MRLAKTLLLGTVSVAIIAGAVIAFDLIGFVQLPAQAADSKKPAAEAPKPQAQAAQTQQPAAAQQAAAAPATVFDEHVKQAKIGACGNIFSALGRGVAADASYAAQTQWDTKAVDAHAVESIVALSGGPSTQGLPAAGVVFTAPVGRSCEGTLVRVTPVKASCQAVATQLVDQEKGQAGMLGALPLVSLPNGARVVLVPLDDNCVAMTSLRAAG
ncbi:hypothetical protein KXR53_34700 [Inquilinus limosus]|uniref:hypothetical protein n=1 Tax=Inquilinus limosus TaxID=171674 RepID=UPI003F140CDF